MEIVLVGLNHRTAPVEVRERVSFTTEQVKRAAEELRARGILEETLVLSTCNRSEVYGVPPESSHECAPGLSTFLSEFHSVRPDILSVSLYHHYDHEAVRHLFRVAAGLDSILLGEEGIIGQGRGGDCRAHGNGARHAAHVRGFSRGEIGGAHFWKTGRAPGAGVGSGHDQRASGLSTPGSWDRATPRDEPLEGPRGRAGQAVRGNGRRVG